MRQVAVGILIVQILDVVRSSGVGDVGHEPRPSAFPLQAEDAVQAEAEAVRGVSSLRESTANQARVQRKRKRMFDVIERLKSEWTDKYVVVDAAVPELARFGQATGFVRTVNMNGRCLVEFDAFNNIAWYDIDPSYLTIVPKPEPKPASEKSAKAAPAKPAAKKAEAEGKPAAKAGKPSTADILAAARGKKAASKPAAAKPAGGRPSTADILAMARGKAAAPEAKAAPLEEPVAAEPAAEEPVAAEPADEPDVSSEPPSAAAAADRPTATTTAEKIAWCRAHDGKGG